MTQNSPTKRRRFRFSLKTLLIVVVVLGVGAAQHCLFWRERTRRIEAEKQAQQNAALHSKTKAKLYDLELRHELTTLQLQNKLLREEMNKLQAESAATGQPPTN